MGEITVEKYKYNLAFMIIGAVFTLVAAVMLIVSVAVNVSWNSFKKTAVSVTAEITDIQVRRERRHSSSNSRNTTTTYHDVYVEYDYNGQHYSEKLGYYYSGMAEGDEISILIDPNDPKRSMTDPGIASAVCLIFVFVFGGIGAVFLIVELRKGAYINRLIRDDKYVYAEYTGEEPSGLRVNNVRYNQSVFTYDSGFGITAEFRSQPHHPMESPYSPGDTVKVYVDMKKDASKHYVSSDSADSAGKIGF